jgi:hypothetical protein
MTVTVTNPDDLCNAIRRQFENITVIYCRTQVTCKVKTQQTPLFLVNNELNS